ncbi:gastrula zinc finger protein XlCGF26.1-like [Chrysoperla carnea]|uniref:gastrula zinc finger protein XlCGF26.1-like n=1 Tax=Chrysoperla carnea TaxID=189513 RepID=UPI001D06C318|nr:gastrula zinc finger protein XlCGF26.1-like [Chrysoperla carnea]
MYNFEKICRTCSFEGELQSLFIEDTILIADMLTEIIDLKVIHGDKYPQNICMQCLNKLKSAYSFKKQCQEIQIKFEQYLQKMIVKEETPFTDNKMIIKDENYENNDEWNDDIYDSSSPAPESAEILDENAEKKVDTDETINQEENENQPPIKKKKSKVVRKRDHVCPICNKHFTSTHLKFHMRSHTKEKPYKCDQCGQQFSLKGNYQRHMKIHTGERPHVCSICGRGFIQTTTLYEHIRIHSNETPFTCNHCGRSFKQQSQLRCHISLKHFDGTPTKEKQHSSTPIKRYTKKRLPPAPGEFQCDICQKKFTSKGVLATHTLIHGEKSYLCSHCGKGFVCKSGLKSHLKTHTGEKPHECKFCGKSFSQISSLATHKLVHTGERPYTCTICNQSFKQKNHLKYHSRTHSGEKPYECSVCGKRFSLNGTLTVHMRTHTGETPYVCSVCNKGFYDSSSMKKHKKKHFIDQENVQEKSFDLSPIT